jgi:hypothetical protein
MRPHASATVTFLLSALLAGSAAAQAAHPNTVPKEDCPARVAPPPAMAGWTRPSPLPAARSEADLAKATLTLGQAITAGFAPVQAVTYRVPPEKADGPQVYGGLYRLQVTEAGTYRIASSAAPWMDVFIGTAPVKSAAFGHGPACTGIGKMVDFPLQPGVYLVQFSESLTPDPEIMVVRTP